MTAELILGKVSELISTGDFDAANEQISNGINNHKDHPQIHFVAAALAAQNEAFDEAIGLYQKALQLAPELQIARFQLGLLLVTLERNEEGAQLLAAIPVSDHYLSHFSKGIIALLNENFDATQQLINIGIELNSENPSLNRDMLDMLERLNQHLAGAGSTLKTEPNNGTSLDASKPDSNSAESADTEENEEDTSQTHLLDIYTSRQSKH